MPQLLSIAFIVFKHCTYGEVYLWVRQWIKPVFQDMSAACMFAELSVEFKNNGSWLRLGFGRCWGSFTGPAHAGDGRSFLVCRKAAGHFGFGCSSSPIWVQGISLSEKDYI